MSTLPKTLNHLKIGEKAPNFHLHFQFRDMDFEHFRKDNWVLMFALPESFYNLPEEELAAFKSEVNYLKAKDIQMVNFISKKTKLEFWDGVALAFHDAPTASEIGKIFMIDDKGTVRSAIYFFQNFQTYFEEMSDLLATLQTIDELNKLETPFEIDELKIKKRDQQGFDKTNFSLDDQNLN